MMKRSRKELKAIAKRALLGNYGTVAGAQLLGILAMIAASVPVLVIMTMTMFAGIAGGATENSVGAGIFIGIGIWYLLILILGMLFMIGTTRICYLFCTSQTGRVGDLLYAFKNHPVRFAGVSLLVTLISLLGALPGILMMIAGEFLVEGAAAAALYLVGNILCFLLAAAVALRYFLAVFVLIEEPWRRVGECIRLSREMMAGNRMRLFVLQLSFFGILMLNYLTFGIGSLWIMPYIISTNVCFYLSVKEETYGSPIRADGADGRTGIGTENGIGTGSADMWETGTGYR